MNVSSAEPTEEEVLAIAAFLLLQQSPAIGRGGKISEFATEEELNDE